MKRLATMSHGLATLALVGFATAAAARGPAVTVYTHDLGYVRETRTLDLGAGRDTVTLPVPERIDFSSVRLAAPGLVIDRLAYRFDVPSGDGALEHARGSRVRITLRGDRVVEGTLVAVDGSWLVVRSDDGALHTLARTAVDDAQLTTPGGRWTMRPALEAVVAARGTRPDAELSYLTGGLSWSAEHVLVRRGERAATWSTRVNVENTTGQDFVDATLKLIAGEPNRVGEAPRPLPMAYMKVAAGAVAEDQAQMTEQGFADYHLYTVERRATLRDKETQSLVMLEPRDLKVAPRYLYRGEGSRVLSQLEIVNDRASGLGVPLPAGRVRCYEPDASGATQFTGETHIEHTPEGEKLTLDVGTAFDLIAERRTLSDRRISDHEREYQVEVKLRNHKSAPVTIVVDENAGGEVTIVDHSHDFVRKDANTIEFTLAVPAGKETVLHYTARQRW